MADEADLLLRRDISHKKVSAWPRGFVLLSALPKAAWSKLQCLCFDAPEGKTGCYVDTACVFPTERQNQPDAVSRLLPLEPALILE